MSNEISAVFVDGETVSHEVLQSRLGFRTVRATKEWIDDCDIPYTPVGKFWFVDSGDVRQAMKSQAKTHTQRREERAGRKERKPHGKKKDAGSLGG